MTKDIHPRKREFIELFETSGWSQSEAARKLDMTRGGINGVITGETVPSPALLKYFKLVLVAENKDAGKLVDETFTEAWCNDLLFELKALPEGQRTALVESFRKIVQAFPPAPTSYRSRKSPSSTPASAEERALVRAAEAVVESDSQSPAPKPATAAPSGKKPRPSPAASPASKGPPAPVTSVPK